MEQRRRNDCPGLSTTLCRKGAAPIITRALAVVLGLGLTGCSGSGGSQVQPPSSSPTSTASPATPAVVRGLPSLPDHPVGITTDAAWVAGEPEPASLSFSDGKGIKVITVQALDALANVAQEDVPADVAGFLQSRRKDVRVSNAHEVTQSGLQAQRFRLEMRDKRRSPSDMWVVGGTGYKPLRADPMEVVAVRSSKGLVWLWTEWQPDDEDASLAAFDAALKNVEVR